EMRPWRQTTGSPSAVPEYPVMSLSEARAGVRTKLGSRNPHLERASGGRLRAHNPERSVPLTHPSLLGFRLGPDRLGRFLRGGYGSVGGEDLGEDLPLLQSPPLLRFLHRPRVRASEHINRGMS